MIKTNIKFTNITSEDEVKDYVEKKLDKVAKLVEQDQDESIFRVEVGKTTEHHQSGEIYRAELQVHFKGKDYRAEETAEDLYSAIDMAQNELWREIKNEREKTETLSRKSGRALKNLIRKFYK